MSIDAVGGQKVIAQTIIDAGADDVLTLKDNHPNLCEDVQLWLDTEVAHGRLPVLETVEKDYGRIEIRRYTLSSRSMGSTRNRTGPDCMQWERSSPPGSSAMT